MGENMLDVPADQLRDLRPPPFRQGIERIVRLFVLGHSSAIRRGHSLRPLSKTKPMLAQATDRRVTDVIGPSDVRKHLSRVSASDCLSPLMAGQLGLATEDNPLAFRRDRRRPPARSECMDGA